MYRKLFFFLIVFSFASVFSQGLDMESVTKAELKQTVFPADTAAPAAILYKKGQTYFRYNIKSGFVSYTEIALKIKIYKKAGLKWANFQIPYYTGYKFLEDEAVEVKKAYTYNLEGDKIIKEKVPGESKFKEKINEYWTARKITFPNVKVGSVIEINYELKTENLSELPDFQFQYDIPVSHIEYTARIPEFYIYKAIKTGYVDLQKEDVIENGSQSFDNEYHKSMVMTYKQVKSVYKAQNIPALKEEKYVNNINNYYGKIKHELEIIRMPDETPKSISGTWTDVAKSVYKEKYFGSELEKFNYFINDLKVIIKDGDTLETKMTKVFNHVKNKMNWNGEYGFYTKNGVEKTYVERTGNVADINLILVAMLKMSGLEANPVLLSTRENGEAFFPNKSFLNYVIAAVNLNGKRYLLDATDKNAAPNYIPVRALNQLGILIKKNLEAEEIELMPKTNSTITTSIMASIDSEGEVAGKIRNQYTHYDAYLFKERNDGFAPESQIDRIQKQHQGLEVSDYSVQSATDYAKTISENFNFKFTEAIEIIGNKMYLTPFLFYTISENPFKQENRQYPVDFMFPHQVKYNINLKIPDGYTIEVTPEPKAVLLPDMLGGMRYNISANGNQIQILYTFDINAAVIESGYYEALKTVFKEIVNKQTERIVLKKT
ncbi:DUF3857 domain-containing protein [Flavobacterium sp.]|uniref:DUF3857 domain-containing protein n=1 Tax=Flavobacterium sp. TaxID=239 RepID=UPI002FDD97DC